MKAFLFFIIFINTNNSFALETLMSCATYHVTTSYALIETEKEIELQVLHHHGTQFMPVHSGLIIKYDLDTIAKNSEALEKLGARYVFRFSKDECQLTTETWKCFSPNEQRQNETPVSQIGFQTYVKRTIVKGREYQNHVMDLSLNINGQNYSIPMEYDISDCRFKWN